MKAYAFVLKVHKLKLQVTHVCFFSPKSEAQYAYKHYTFSKTCISFNEILQTYQTFNICIHKEASKSQWT